MNSLKYKLLHTARQLKYKRISSGVPPLTLQNVIAGKLLNYQIYGNSKQGELPEGYTQLEYIESNGEQYVDIGEINLDTYNTKLEYTGQWLSGSNNQIIFSYGEIAAKTNFKAWEYSGGYYVSTLGKESNIISTTVSTKHKVVMERTSSTSATFTVDGDLLVTTSGTFVSSSMNAYLLGVPDFIQRCYIGKLWYLKLWQNDVLIRNFIPCKNSNGTIGMYDLVNNVFYENAGTGDFVAGPEMPNTNSPIEIQIVGDNETGLPLGYTQVEYIECNGEQYVDTGINPTNHKIEVEFEVTSLVNNVGEPVFGINQYVSGESIHRYHFTVYNNKYYWAIPTGENNAGTFTFGKHKVTYNDNENNVYLDNELLGSTSGVSISEANILLGYRKMNNIYFHGKYYSCTITDNSTGKIVRNFIPCKDSNATIGMYDTMTNTFYTNQGIGNFTAGDEIAKGGYKITVNVKGKNLFDYSTRTDNYSINEYGSLFTANGDAVSDFIPVKPNTTYYCTRTGSRRGKFFDINKQAVQTSSFDFSLLSSGSSFITSSTTCYVRFAISGSEVDRTKIQLEKGSAATDYEPYFNKTENIYLNEPLRKTGNADAVKLPDGYTQLEYIESTGTQYIDTGAMTTLNSNFEMEVSFNGTWNYEPSYIIGCQDDVNGGSFLFNFPSSSTFTNGIYTWFDHVYRYAGDTTTKYIKDVDYTNRSLVRFKNNYFYYGNKFIQTHTRLERINRFTVHLFGAKITSDDVNIFKSYNMRLYNFKLYDGETIVRNMTPAKNSSGEIGMYDTVNDTFYTNAGTGSFVAGPEIYSDILIFKIKKVIRNVGFKYFKDLNLKKSGTQPVANAIKIYTNDIKQNTDYIIDNSKWLCNSLIYTNDTNEYINATKSVINPINVGINFCFLGYNSSITIEELKSYIDNDYFIYPLATPTEETIELPDILLNKGTNIIDVETSLKPSNIEVEYLSKSKI